MMLTRLSSFSAGEAGGASSSSVWHLCPNGGFVYLRSPGGVETSDPSASGDESRQGTGSWRVEMRGTDALLVLTTANGTQTVHSLEYDGTKLYLDEAQVSRSPSKRCDEGLN